jgi:single-stranded-DNA-specific exonuclease
VDHARHAVDLLLAEDANEAATLARVLHEQNNARRQVERRVVAQALDEVERRGLHRHRVIVVGRVGWPAGVLGLAASRLAERFHRPSIVVSFDDEPGRGSGRSVNGFDLYAALEAASDHLAGFGGHRHAAGVRVERDRLDDFSAAVNLHADDLPEDVFRPSIDVDAVIGLEDIDVPLVELLQGLEPFGAENRTPLFAALGVEVTGWPRLIGRNREHLTFRVRSGGCEFDAVAWKRGPELPNLEPGEPGSLDLCFTVERHTWQNRTTTRLNVRDLRSKDAGPAA